VDRPRLGEQGRHRRARAQCREAAIERPLQVDRRRSCGGDAGTVADRAREQRRRRRPVALHAEHEAVGRRDADRRGAAHAQARDRVDHLLDALQFEHHAAVWQRGLVQQAQPAGIAVEPGQRRWQWFDRGGAR
jgi:hypothetical protein